MIASRLAHCFYYRKPNRPCTQDRQGFVAILAIILLSYKKLEIDQKLDKISLYHDFLKIKMQKKIESLTIGIIGGGQLGRMTSHAAQSLGFNTIIFTDKKDSPAVQATQNSVIADYNDKDALQEFAKKIDIATFEFENIPVASVEFLNSMKPVYPSANVLKITQHRILEKSFLRDIGVEVADFAVINNENDLLTNLKKFGGKAILKTATMGYDGKGQFVLENESAARDALAKFDPQKQPLILEKFCPFLSEISVLVARSTNGEIACYEPLGNSHKNGILDVSVYPAKVQESTKNNAKKIAEKIAQNLDLQGVVAVEFFVMENEKLLVNELAPRPHNSYHFSQNGAITSQFEQLVRAITALPLGSTQFHSHGFMKNLIGDDVNNLQEFISNKNAKIHLYGKDKPQAGRKMGHVNVIS